MEEPYEVVAARVIEFPRDALKSLAVLLCADIPFETALAFRNDDFHGLIKLRDVPEDVRFSEVYARRDVLEAYSARALTVL